MVHLELGHLLILKMDIMLQTYKMIGILKIGNNGNKKAAEQSAAQEALDALDQNPDLLES